MRRGLRNVTGGLFVSDIPAGGAREKVNWISLIGVMVTILSLGAAGLQYIGTVNAKADFALAQISEMKTQQRQTSADTRDDLKSINAKLDNIILTVGRNGTTNGKY